MTDLGGPGKGDNADAEPLSWHVRLIRPVISGRLSRKALHRHVNPSNRMAPEPLLSK